MLLIVKNSLMNQFQLPWPSGRGIKILKMEARHAETKSGHYRYLARN
jgi:hypothetical protein